MYPKTVQKLIELFSKFPTIGPRTAARFVFYLMKMPKEELKFFLDSIVELRKKIKLCSFCFNPFEPALSETTDDKDEKKLCPICQNLSRNKVLLCIVATEADLTAIEKTKKYSGLYFILGGTLSKLKKENIQGLRVKELEKLIKNHSEIQEVILAINPTIEGETTSLYLERLLKLYNIKITRLGRGLPVGGELEYADQETLTAALESRK